MNTFYEFNASILSMCRGFHCHVRRCEHYCACCIITASGLERFIWNCTYQINCCMYMLCAEHPVVCIQIPVSLPVCPMHGHRQGLGSGDTTEDTGEDRQRPGEQDCLCLLGQGVHGGKVC